MNKKLFTIIEIIPKKYIRMKLKFNKLKIKSLKYIIYKIHY